MGRSIATILTLRDNMSGGIMRVSRNVQGMTRETRRATQQVATFASNAKKQFESIGDKAIKLSTGVAAAVTGLALKSGFTEAFDMEGYRVQLETATKDTKKASQLMTDAVKFANATPFETGEIVQATAKMEVYGMSSKRWLKDVADMAGATNKSIDQATEAMADVSVGEFERIKEFGITKNMILLASDKKYGKASVINAKGQVVNQKKLMDTVQEMMQQKFKGGAEKLSQTTKGLWSTVTGITKSSLAKITGMQEDGTIKQGSLLDTVKGKIKEVADQFQKWQDDGTIANIANKATEVFTKIIEVGGKAFNFLKENKTTIENVAIVFGSFYVAIKIMSALKTVIFGVQIAMALMNGTLVLTPFGWAVIAIGLLISAAVLLWKNWDTVSTKLSAMWVSIKDSFATGVNWVTGKINSLIGVLNHIPGVNIPVIATMQTSKMKETSSLQGKRGMTEYASGGIATKASIFGEDGAEMAIPLKKNNSRSKALLNQTDKIINGGKSSGVNVYVTIQGNVIGNEEYADFVGNHVVTKVVKTLKNM